MLKKFSAFMISMAAAAFIACGDDSGTSPNESADSSSSAEQSSSSEEIKSSSSNAISSSSKEVKSSSSEEAKPSSSAEASENNWKDYCLEAINKYRATEDLPAYTLADDSKQECADKQSADDLATNKAHGHFGDCKEYGQNSGPNVSVTRYANEEAIVDTYLKMMWDEKKLIESGERDPNKDSDFSYIGHYLNMSSKRFKSVACGFAKSTDGKTGWINFNFY